MYEVFSSTYEKIEPTFFWPEADLVQSIKSYASSKGTSNQ